MPARTSAGASSGAIIAPGVRVGENCLVAAGAVITRDVPDRMLMAGNPARVLRSRANDGVHNARDAIDAHDPRKSSLAG